MGRFVKEILRTKDLSYNLEQRITSKSLPPPRKIKQTIIKVQFRILKPKLCKTKSQTKQKATEKSAWKGKIILMEVTLRNGSE